MGQQMADRHRLVEVDEGNVRPIFDRDLQTLELGYELRHRVKELEVALLVEHHQRDAGHRLGHRVETEDRIGAHRLAAVALEPADCLVVHHLPPPARVVGFIH